MDREPERERHRARWLKQLRRWRNGVCRYEAAGRAVPERADQASHEVGPEQELARQATVGAWEGERSASTNTVERGTGISRPCGVTRNDV